MSTYGRPQLQFPRLTSTVKTVIFVLLGCYVLQLVLENFLGIGVSALLAMTPAGPGIWQLLTYVLIDGGHPLMFLIGLLFVWWALSPFEASFGPRRTLQLCFVSALGASVPAYLAGFVIPMSPQLYGSQALWFGGITATTWLHRDRQMNFFGMMAMTAKQFLLLLLGLSVLMFLASKNHTHFIANLGAMAAGIGFVRWMMRPRTPPRVRKRSGDTARSRGLRVIDGGGSGDDERPKYLN